VADIFNAHGDAWRHGQAGHVSLGQRKVMSAIQRCRTEVLGGHVLHCEQCGTDRIAYNSCRNRHCPKCCGSKAEQWLNDRKIDLLDVEYYHVVFTLPAEIGHIAYQNKAVVYDLLFKAAAETLTTIARDPKHLGAKIGFTAVLHTWGSAMTHHPHIHRIVPGGGLSPDGTCWIPCKRGFFLPVRVLSRLFRRLFLDRLLQAHDQLQHFGDLEHLADPTAFRDCLAPLRTVDWVVYAKRPFAGPEAMLTYLSRYTHRVAISNHRLLNLDDRTVTFQVKDYRKKHCLRYEPMTLAIGEFIRRFLLHVLPTGFHRIRHYGFLASPSRRNNLTRIRELLEMLPDSISEAAEPTPEKQCPFICRSCGEPMAIIQVLRPRTRAPP
jgi:hypothetical protein